MTGPTKNSLQENGATRGSLDSEYMRLWTTNQRRVHGFILTLLPFGADAEEVLQEVSITAWQKFEEVSDEIGSSSEAFVRWTCAIARFKSLSFIRQSSGPGRVVFSDELVEELAVLQESQSEYLMLRDDALAGCISKLKERDRSLLQSRYESGLSVKQISSAVSMSTSSVYAALQRVRLSLLRCVELSLDTKGA